MKQIVVGTSKEGNTPQVKIEHVLFTLISQNTFRKNGKNPEENYVRN